MKVHHRRPSVLIAEDHVLVGEGIAMALSPFFDIAGSVRALSDLTTTVGRCQPDVVVLDISFGTESSIPVMQKILKGPAPRPRFVMLTAHESPSLSRAAFSAGAIGYVLKGSSVQDLRLAVNAAMEDRRFVSGAVNPPSVLPQVPGAARTRIRIGGLVISRRQAEIISLIHTGLSREEVAEHLGLTLKGVDYNLTSARKATGFSRMIDLLRWWDETWPEAEKQLSWGAE